MTPPTQHFSLHRLSSKQKHRRNVISLTPLIDVVFILLVFFMLASSFLEWRSIDLSAAEKASGSSSVDGAILIEQKIDGLHLAGEKTNLTQISQYIRKQLNDNADQRVLLKPYPGISVQESVSIIDQLADIGVSNLSLVSSSNK